MQVGCKPSVPHPRDTHMQCLANNLNSVAQSVAYLINMQADRRSHPAYFSWRVVSSPDDSRRPKKIVSEYDQEIPQSQTADNPVEPRGRAAQPSLDTRKTN